MTQSNQLPSELRASDLGSFFELHRANLRNFLERRINRKLTSRLDASDVIQEVFFRAQQSLAGYVSNPVVPPVVWLRHLSKQVLCEVHRKQFRTVRNPFREENQLDDVLVMSLTQSSVSIHSKIERMDLQTRIRDKLLELNVIDREVLEMRHIDGHSLSEIATTLNIHFETVKKRYYRALKKLRELIEPRIETQ
jgi:RNA polymerase sigma factor (sigma-70 family)